MAERIDVVIIEASPGGEVAVGTPGRRTAAVTTAGIPAIASEQVQHAAAAVAAALAGTGRPAPGPDGTLGRSSWTAARPAAGKPEKAPDSHLAPRARSA
jgi:hypothetical protein